MLLTEDDQGRAAFSETGLVPGETGEQCIVVASGSDFPGEVRSYLQNLTTSAQALENYIEFQVEIGEGGSFDDCTGFTPDPGALPPAPLSALTANNYDYATDGVPWQTEGTPGESRTYRGTWTFDTTGLTQQQIDSVQGAQVSVDIVWDLQSDEDLSA
ncbi:hypothetical protein V2J56_12220 [Georgenia sp. MJ206]|uniref:hypothetical protein n=1 Tax=Georgenia wangjunii TaxID=3117730 RepID=UPI002F264ABB